MAVALAYAAGEALFWGVVEPTLVFASVYSAEVQSVAAAGAVAAAATALAVDLRDDDEDPEEDNPFWKPFPEDEVPGGVIDDGSHKPNHISDGPPTHTFIDEMRKDAHREFRIYKHMLLRYRHHIIGPAAFAGLVKFCRRFWMYLSQRERADMLRIGHRRLSRSQYRTVRNIALSLAEAGSQATPVRRAADFMDPWRTPKRRRH